MTRRINTQGSPPEVSSAQCGNTHVSNLTGILTAAGTLLLQDVSGEIPGMEAGRKTAYQSRQQISRHQVPGESGGLPRKLCGQQSPGKAVGNGGGNKKDLNFMFLEVCAEELPPDLRICKTISQPKSPEEFWAEECNTSIYIFKGFAKSSNRHFVI